MTDPQWQELLRVIAGERVVPSPVGLIVDSPWLPGWAGYSIVDYLASDAIWLNVNLRAADRFPQVMLLPGFWAEFGMATEPSAFGCKCVWPIDEFPYVEKIAEEIGGLARLKRPNCRTDGLLPFVVKRLEHLRPAIERAGHRIRFAVARGPMNIASYLLGQTEFLTALKVEPEATHRLLAMVSEFLVEWLAWQRSRFDSIDAILVLDDLVGFVGRKDFGEFALPYLKQVFGAFPASVRALHNDAHGLITARHLAEIGVNLFNFSFEHSLATIRELAGDSVTLLGNLPPRLVLAEGTPDDVRRATIEMLASVGDPRRVLFSAGGGTPPGVPSENIDALCATVRQWEWPAAGH
jgi:uroporphyrinogen decarboxylase